MLIQFSSEGSLFQPPKKSHLETFFASHQEAVDGKSRGCCPKLGEGSEWGALFRAFVDPEEKGRSAAEGHGRVLEMEWLRFTNILPCLLCLTTMKILELPETLFSSILTSSKLSDISLTCWQQNT